MKRALYAGSFDPFTNGHLHVIKTASLLFDEVIVDIGVNDQKKRHYREELMKKAIEEVFMELGITNVKVIIHNGLTVDAASLYDVDILIRGLRNQMDLVDEENIADFNYDVGNIDTIYIRAGKTGSISSSKVRELIKYDKDITSYVPSPIKRLIIDNK